MSDRFTFPALGTQWWVEIFDDIPPETLAAIKDDSEGFVSAFEERYSRFKPDSLVSRLNREREIADPPAEFLELLRFAKQLYLRSNSTFNPLLGHVLEARGYGTAGNENGDSSENPNPISDLEVSEESVKIHAGSLDFGGFGKGYLIDRLVSQLQHEHGMQHFLVNGGGDIYATSKQGEPIEIVLEHPTKPGMMLTKTPLINQGFAASSPFKRQWVRGNERHTHIVGDIKSEVMFVKAKTAADADAFATTMLLSEKAEQENLAQREQLGIAKFNLSDNTMTANQLFM
jgi:thiamine biosynthesis lipoprotein